ncbi:rho guanine nucleotide exchange factor 10 isoform X1 [Tachysurus ichikawai]
MQHFKESRVHESDDDDDDDDDDEHYGSWDSSSVRLLKLGVLPVKALLAVGECVWASSGGHVFVIDAHTHTIEHQLEAHQEEGMVVSQMVVAGVGIWIAFSSGSTLRLFHTETLEHLQDINIATPVHNILSEQRRGSEDRKLPDSRLEAFPEQKVDSSLLKLH